jgi:hypothetical protein
MADNLSARFPKERCLGASISFALALLNKALDTELRL